jgi:hypothetical protein
MMFFLRKAEDSGHCFAVGLASFIAVLLHDQHHLYCVKVCNRLCCVVDIFFIARILWCLAALNLLLQLSAQ